MPMRVGDPPPEIIEEMNEMARELTAKLIPVLEQSRLDVAAMVLAMLLGQNLAVVVRDHDIDLETLVDRAILGVRTSAQHELTDAPDVDAGGKPHLNS